MPASTPGRVPADPPPGDRAIENLITTYAELVDDGDFAGLGTLPVGHSSSCSCATGTNVWPGSSSPHATRSTTSRPG